MVTYLQDFILQHRELVGISCGEIVADFGKSGHSHSLGLKIPAGGKNGFLVEAHVGSLVEQEWWGSGVCVWRGRVPLLLF